MPSDSSRKGNSTKKKAGGYTSPKKKRRKSAKSNGTCFVLMPFREPFDTYFSVIFEPAVTAADLKPLRGDSLFRPSPIMADVWQMIQDSKVLLAEMTGKNANVFYELGLAHALGKPVILVSETIEDVPFDLQPLRVILYDKSDPAWGSKLKSDIASSLGETLADVAKAVPPMFRKIVKSQAPEDSDLSVRLFELERRVAAMSSVRSSFIKPTPLSETPGEDPQWGQVMSYLASPDRLKTPRFDSRPHAVAWAIDQLGQYSPATVQKKLKKRFEGAIEGDRVFELATSPDAARLISQRHRAGPRI